ncbi:MAG: hypothetical protein IPK73_31330 [Candidatus Obscuribacter sp.]|nr:hypothetical protein [Candidatus Obscuribacter sp.]
MISQFNQDNMEAVYIRTILRHDMLSIAIMRLAEHDVFKHLKSEGLLSNYKQQPYYTSGYWRSVHDRDYQLMLDLTGNLDAPL